MTRLRRTARVAAATVLLTAALTGPAPAHAGPAPADPSVPVGRGMQVRSVTLITGDRLSMHGAGNVVIHKGPGRERIPVRIEHHDGRLRVTPADAGPLLRAGRLDPRLFDVTTLLESGYDDTRADVPLIVTGAGAGAGAGAGGRAGANTPAGIRPTRELPAAHGIAGRAARSDLPAVWRGIVAAGTGPSAPKIWLDGLRAVDLDVSVPLIGAPAAWAGGFTGAGVTVAVIDTGVDDTHPDLAGQVIARRSFVPDGTEVDDVGHGTHVAATVAGTGAGRYKGVAPEAKIIAAKVCDLRGCPESSIIEGMRWAVTEQHADVVNMSLGGPDTPEVDPVEQAVQDLTAGFGALFVISAGNAGADRSVGSPGVVDAALTVGAVDDHDALAPFSSRGPRPGDAALKPDITAPGVDITAARSADAPDVAPPGERYVTMSGTSMAAPHVAGAAAILAQRRPDWDPATLKAALMGSARPNPEIGVFGQGAGRVDVAAAVAGTVTAGPPSVSFGRQAWPHGDDEMLTRTVTYHNHGPTGVTLDLTLEPAGDTPAGLFTLRTATVTVPAGGTADAVVTADTRVDVPDAFYGAAVVAAPAGGGPVTRTPMAVEKEVESYDVTFTHTDRAGNPSAQYFTALQGIDNPHGDYVINRPGPVVVRVPKGRYFVQSQIIDGDLEDPEAEIDTSLLLQPVLEVSAPASVALDARAAGPVRVPAPRGDAGQVFGLALISVPVDGGAFGFGIGVDTFDGLYMGAAGGDITLDGLVTKISGTWARTAPDGSTMDSPYRYDLAWTHRNRAVTGFSRTVDDRHLAKVAARYLSRIPAGTGAKATFSHTRGIDFGGAVDVPFHTPATRTEFHTTDDVTWAGEFTEHSADDSTRTLNRQEATAYRVGRTHRETWNRGMWGPGLPGGYDPASRAWLGRVGDQLIVNVPTYTDGDGRAGFSTGTGTMTVYRDGVRLGTADSIDGAAFDVPPGKARYRVEIDHRRSAPFETSTGVSLVFEFESDTTPESRMTPLDVSVVRFDPALDGDTSAPAGCRFVLPVSVQRQLGARDADNRKLAVQVSYDDGTTWLPAPVRTRDGHRVVELHHPRGSGFVSVRATATDTAGGTVEQTVLRAYRFG